ncbi:YifB family Mg chelatase-like AAA ATPase [Usitatibacter palustris]|uniref:Competence protein ComM n=1 Tax=Usitatibacter palustris TaxID=2732487 RepID=A0A6M4HAG1_9PROT|nr:YifB family Mg chelatase-like AAA ATPase [Usitatibacter palustris]QJR16541.1 Competence protein ComM [Usitatibacter palustris]
MALAVVYSRGLEGLDAPLVRVEAHAAGGLPAFNIVGLPAAEVKEARDRVRAALNTARFKFPNGRVTVSLAPADLPKESGRFDLPIAIGILAATDQIKRKILDQHEFAGELALSGELRSIRGALAMTYGAKRDGRAFVVPESVADEAVLARGATVLPARTLLQVCAHLSGETPLVAYESRTASTAVEYPDLEDVRGQAQARRALEVAAAGGHSLLMRGPPGTGKSMLALRLPGILPALSEDEALQSAAIQSLGSTGFRADRFGQRAFRNPHHSASAVALVGGGSPPRPGEVSLAHHGVLFLDELPEFERRVLEMLREPLDAGAITISRAARQADFPARFQLVAAMNPCPCGYLGHFTNQCRCTPDRIASYNRRISGPLLDRIDLRVEVCAVAPSALVRSPPGESSERVRERVAAARAVQIARQGVVNAALHSKALDRWCVLDDDGSSLLLDAVARLGLSARACHRVLRVARTVADLEGRERIGRPHVAEAIQYRG